MNLRAIKGKVVVEMKESFSEFDKKNEKDKNFEGTSSFTPQSTLFSSTKSDVLMKFIKHNIEPSSSRICISLPSDVVALRIEKWKDCLVGYIIGKKKTSISYSSDLYRENLAKFQEGKDLL